MKRPIIIEPLSYAEAPITNLPLLSATSDPVSNER